MLVGRTDMSRHKVQMDFGRGQLSMTIRRGARGGLKNWIFDMNHRKKIHELDYIANLFAREKPSPKANLVRNSSHRNAHRSRKRKYHPRKKKRKSSRIWRDQRKCHFKKTRDPARTTTDDKIDRTTKRQHFSQFKNVRKKTSSLSLPFPSVPHNFSLFTDQRFKPGGRRVVPRALNHIDHTRRARVFPSSPCKYPIPHPFTCNSFLQSQFRRRNSYF